MKQFSIFICSTVVFIITSCDSILQDNESKIISKWISAWNYMSNKIPSINNSVEVNYIFFNDIYVYSTSKITAQNGVEVVVEGSDKKWFRNKHHNKIILPNGEIFVPTIAVFTAPSTIKNRLPFFVMPLNSFWERNGLKSKNSTLENLTTAIFLHEFSHTQQLKTFGRKISDFEKNNKFKVDLTDNLIQDLYQNNSAYKKLFELELFYFNETLENKEDSLKFYTNLKIGIKYLNKRQSILSNEYGNETVLIDNQFLTIEGLGQYLMYLWLIDENGAKLNPKKAIEEVRRNRAKWSQDEGLTIFLIQDYLSQNNKWFEDINTETTIIKYLLR